MDLWRGAGGLLSTAGLALVQADLCAGTCIFQQFIPYHGGHKRVKRQNDFSLRPTTHLRLGSHRSLVFVS